MIKIKISLENFISITFEDTLNYTHFPTLEKSINDLMDYLQVDMNTLSRKKEKFSQEQRMAYFLKKSLLYMTTDPACIKSLEECSEFMDNNYIHIILKKHYLKLEYDFEYLIS